VLNKVTYSVVILLLVFLGLVILSNSMTKPLGHDEQMYCSAPALLSQGKMIYRDFPFVAQMPYHSLLCALLFKLFDTSYYLLTTRLFSVVCDILTVICIVGIYRSIFSSSRTTGLLLGAAAAALYVFNPLAAYTSGFAWNHDLVILLVVASFWIFLSIDFQKKSQYWYIALTGALLTLATCTRITTALVWLLFFLIILLKSRTAQKNKSYRVLSFLGASALILIWPLWLIIQAPLAFLFDVFWFPMLNAEWLKKVGPVNNRAVLISKSLTTPGYLCLMAIALYLCLALLCHRKKTPLHDILKLSLAPMLTFIFFLIAVIPPTMWKQYLGVPVAFIVISFAYPLLYLKKLGPNKQRSFYIASALIAITTAISILSYPALAVKITRLAKPKTWVPVRIHKISLDIARKTKKPKLILTLAPLFALEGGCKIYPELSTGPFSYRVADYTSQRARQLTHTVGPKSLSALVEKTPPSAVILSIEPLFLEKALRRVALKGPYTKEVFDNAVVVYFKPYTSPRQQPLPPYPPKPANITLLLFPAPAAPADNRQNHKSKTHNNAPLSVSTSPYTSRTDKNADTHPSASSLPSQSHNVDRL